MKKRTMVIGSLIVLIAIALGTVSYMNGGLQALRLDAAETESAADAVIPAVESVEQIIADAVVVPARDATLSMSTGGVVADVLVSEGDSVEAGAPLIQLNAARQRAAVAQAEANLHNAELHLAELTASPRMEAVARYRAAVTLAEATLQKVMDGPTDADMTVARANLAKAEAVRRKAQADYDVVGWATNINMLPQATALEAATNDYVTAQALLDEVQAGPKEADITAAQAQVESAQAALDELFAGAKEETIAAAEANVDAARAALQNTQVALDEMTLQAPFAGVVATINAEVGEQVSPGVTLVRLGDFSHWVVETDDLTELDMVHVQPGDHVEIAVDALPDETFAGHVTHITPFGENKLGDITYRVVAELDEQDERLCWNMTAAVNITRNEAGRMAVQQGEVDDTANGAATAKIVADLIPMDEILTDEMGLEVDLNQDAPSIVVATVETGGDLLNVRAGPGTDYAVVGVTVQDQGITIIGRNVESTWLLIERSSAGSSAAPGWVSADYVTTDLPLHGLPISGYIQEVPVPAVTNASAGLADQPIVGLEGILVFQSSNGGTIYAYDTSNGVLWPLTNGFDPAISPDGQTVAFTRNGGEQGLYLIDVDGSNEHRIYAGSEGLRAPSWSPDGEWIVFSHRTGEFTCRDVGSGLCYPDNPMIQEFPLVTKDEFGISRVDVNGDEFRDITSLNTAVAPDWSEAGILYQSASGLQRTADEPEAEDEALVQDHFCQDPAWQPGGNRIVFQRQEGNHREIYTLNADGSDLQALTRPPDLLARIFPQSVAPEWSQDGQHIAFLSNRNSNGTIGGWSIWVMDADGGNQQRLPIDVDINYSFQNEQVISW